MTLDVLVVDDEEPARRRLRDLLAKEDGVRLIGECPDGPSAIDAIEEQKPDLVFLDVQMPEMDGFELLAALDPATLPAIVFVTAYDRHALAAFDAGALDYLLKPFTVDRFRETLGRVRERVRDAPEVLLERLESFLARERGALRSGPERLAVPGESGVRFLDLADIGWIESDRNYVVVHAGGEAHRMRHTLKALIARLRPEGFLRIHQSYVVNASRIRELRPWSHGELVVVLDDGTSLVSSRTYTPELRELMEP